jgi:HAD superfamily hydrolase (TIGR01509 family)
MSANIKASQAAQRAVDQTVKAWLFIDFDNTMMGTEQFALPSLIARFNDLYGAEIRTPLTYDVFNEHFHGLAREGLCRAIGGYYGITVDYPTLFESRDWRMMQYMKTIPGGIPMAPHLVETLTTLQKRGIIASFVSNNNIQRALGTFQVADNKCGDDLLALLGTRFFEAGDAQKPKPDIYLRAVEFLDADPKRSFAIEDSVTGVLSATTAGLVTFGFTGFADDKKLLADKLSANGAHAVFDDWADFPALLNRQL